MAVVKAGIIPIFIDQMFLHNQRGQIDEMTT